MKHLRIIAPSESWKPLKAPIYERARQRLEDRDWTTSYGEHIKNVYYLGSASAEQRVYDLHAAYTDKTVCAVMALHGGFIEIASCKS